MVAGRTEGPFPARRTEEAEATERLEGRKKGAWLSWDISSKDVGDATALQVGVEGNRGCVCGLINQWEKNKPRRQKTETTRQKPTPKAMEGHGPHGKAGSDCHRDWSCPGEGQVGGLSWEWSAVSIAK